MGPRDDCYDDDDDAALSRKEKRKTVPEPFLFFFSVLSPGMRAQFSIHNNDGELQVSGRVFVVVFVVERTNLTGQYRRMTGTSRHVCVHLDASRSRPGDF